MQPVNNRGELQMKVDKTLFGACLVLLVSSTFCFAQAPATPDVQTANPTSVLQSAASPDPAGSSESTSRALLSCFDWIGHHKACAIVFGSIILFIVLITAALLISAGRPSAKSYITTLKPSFFFWLGISYLLLLLVIAAFYIGIMPPKHAPLFLGDVLPIAVPWFGAVGAVLISLEGIFAYGQRDWDPKFNYWHIGRPLFGAVLGIVAFFTYVLIVISSGSVPAFLEGKEPSAAPKDYIIYYIVAFLVGYREETFRELVRRVTDLILKPGSASPDAPAVTFKEAGVVIAYWDFKSVTPPGSKTITIDIENTGKETLKSPSISLDKSTAAEFTTANDKLTGGTELKPGEVKSVDIKFTPTTAGAPYSGVLTVIGSNLATPAKLAMSGRG
jgi:hypothetical protein